MKTICVSVFVFALVGCNPQADNVAGAVCPVDEVCSDATPYGLYFQGASPWDSVRAFHEPGRMAVGGTQFIRLATERFVGSPDFALPFDAKSNGPAFGINAVLNARIAINALAPGSAHLRIVEPGSDILYDRVSINVETVNSVEIEPYDSVQLEDWFDNGQQDDWAIFSGTAEVDVIVRVWGNGRLVDESMQITGARQRRWDNALLTPPLSGSVALAARLGNGDTYNIDVPVVSVADDIEQVVSPLSRDITEPLVVGRSGFYCFRALSANRVVYGATWDVVGTFGVEVSVSQNCVGVSAVQAGSATLSVTAAGRTQDFVVTIVSAATEGPAPRFSGTAPTLNR